MTLNQPGPTQTRPPGLVTAAPDLWIAAALALQLIQDTWIEEHGNEQVGQAWGALERALAQADIPEPNPTEHRGTS
jgi:hypothetical protein